MWKDVSIKIRAAANNYFHDWLICWLFSQWNNYCLDYDSDSEFPEPLLWNFYTVYEQLFLIKGVPWSFFVK